MRLLLDSHSLIWAVEDPSRLSPAAKKVLQDPANELVLSAATVREISIKVGVGKLTLSSSFRDWMNRAIADLGLTLLPVTVEYADAQAALPWHHRDPFDRLIIAQARIEAMPIVSSDAKFDAYGISRVW
jgi:PIN domain nuclease of toxin-antitoxin system